jgi:serine/threonine-protein kinase
MTPVAVAAFPDTANVFRDGTLVHQVPTTIEVEEGKPVTIEVRADNYETQTLVLDGTDTSKMVKLVQVRGIRPGVLKPAVDKGKGKGKGTSGGTDVRDPWGNK